jgi:carbonic anhydrase
MSTLKHLLDNNTHWSERMHEERPDFFQRLSKQQKPEYLWIGCADSRVPATEIVDLLPGEIFVHRNVANLVVHTDLNCLTVIHYAVEVLAVKHIIVCGHYGCGGVEAAMDNAQHGLVDNWLLHIKDIYNRNGPVLDAIEDPALRFKRLCELNVIEQAYNVCHTTIVQNAWRRAQALTVHGWIYGLSDGRLRDLGICITNPSEVPEIYHKAASL